jgi:hypothetical protein
VYFFYSFCIDAGVVPKSEQQPYCSVKKLHNKSHFTCHGYAFHHHIFQELANPETKFDVDTRLGANAVVLHSPFFSPVVLT